MERKSAVIVCVGLYRLFDNMVVSEHGHPQQVVGGTNQLISLASLQVE